MKKNEKQLLRQQLQKESDKLIAFIYIMNFLLKFGAIIFTLFINVNVYSQGTYDIKILSDSNLTSVAITNDSNNLNFYFKLYNQELVNVTSNIDNKPNGLQIKTFGDCKSIEYIKYYIYGIEAAEWFKFYPNGRIKEIIRYSPFNLSDFSLLERNDTILIPYVIDGDTFNSPLDSEHMIITRLGRKPPQEVFFFDSLGILTFKKVYQNNSFYNFYIYQYDKNGKNVIRSNYIKYDGRREDNSWD
jgi:hypothetical protein